MKKMQLELAALTVESFAVLSSPELGQGTVHAHLSSFRCDTKEQCPLTLYTIGCTDYCEPGPGETNDCPEEPPPSTVVVPPGC